MAVSARRFVPRIRKLVPVLALGLAAAPAPTLLSLPGAAPVAAQSAAELLPEDLLPRWMSAWSPFTLGADLPRTLGRPAPNPNLILPSPRIGLFWSRGNPGALPFEVADPWSDFRATTSDLSGEFRRPADIEQTSSPGVSAIGWRTIGEGGAVVGRMVSDQRTTVGSPALSLRPYGSSPFSAVDTTAAEARVTRARLEGAGGWRLGRVGLGVAGGFEAHDHVTKATGVPRFGRSSAPAASAGVVVELDAGTHLGAYGRWSGFAETTQMIAVSQTGQVFGINGYREPTTQGVTSGFPYFLRIEHDARAAGISGGGTWNALSWTAFVEADRLHQDRWNDRSRHDPEKDRWTADARTVGLSAQRSLARMLWTLDTRWTTLSGEGRLAEAEEVEFEAEESAVAGSLEARMPLVDRAWTAAVRASVSFESRHRQDPVAELFTDLEALSVGLAGSIGFAPREGTLVTAGLGHTAHRTRGAIPGPAGEGPAYRRALAPGIALLASPASSWSLSLGAGHRLRSDILLWVHAERASLAPGRGLNTPQLAPGGNRAATHLAAGVTLSP
jgi:hypothetical protein